MKLHGVGHVGQERVLQRVLAGNASARVNRQQLLWYAVREMREYG